MAVAPPPTLGAQVIYRLHDTRSPSGQEPRLAWIVDVLNPVLGIVSLAIQFLPRDSDTKAGKQATYDYVRYGRADGDWSWPMEYVQG